MFIIICICSFVSVVNTSIIYYYFLKEGKKSINRLIRIFCLIYSFSYFILTTTKTILHDGSVTLYSSFADAKMITFWHYSLPIEIILIILIYLLSKYKSEKLNNLEDLFLPIQVICVGTACFWGGNITNTVFILLYVTSFLASIMISKCKAILIKSYSLKNRLYRCAFLSLCFFGAQWLFYPIELYCSNASEMSISIRIFLNTALEDFIIYFFIFFFVSLFTLDGIFLDFFEILALLWAILGYVQSTFLNTELIRMDGVIVNWHLETLFINIIIWIAIIVGLIGICVFANNGKKIVRYIAGFVVALQIFTSMTLLLTTDNLIKDNSENMAFSTKEMLTLASEENVVVFVLDWFDTQFIDQIEQLESDYLTPLNDFTYYSNTTSKYAFTNMGIPYLLTGVDCPGEMSESDYRDYAYKNSEVLKTIDGSGFDIRLFTDTNCVNDVYDVVDNITTEIEDEDINEKALASLIQKTSKYRMLPYLVKNNYAYSDNDFDRCNDSRKLNYYVNDDIPFYNSVLTKGISISEEYSKAFRFYHLNGAHPPVIKNEKCEYDYDCTLYDEAKGALLIVYEYIQAMKEAGVYDSALIIITADHGQNMTLGEKGLEQLKTAGLNDATSNPILFVKYPGENHDNLVENEVALTQKEVIGTVLENVSSERSDYWAVDSIEEDFYDRRSMIVFRSGDYPWTIYSIEGNVKDINSWNPQMK